MNNMKLLISPDCIGWIFEFSSIQTNTEIITIKIGFDEDKPIVRVIILFKQGFNYEPLVDLCKRLSIELEK